MSGAPICTQCRHYSGSPWGFHHCTRFAPVARNEVTGAMIPKINNCYDEREGGLAALIGLRCGPKARFFEPAAITEK